jgi:shikimate kinase
VALVGYMGSGKSTVGRVLAEELGWGFVDLDREVEGEAGMTIAEVFETRGEPAFRELERAALEAALLDGPRERVVACGGGVVIDARNRELLGEATTVFLWEDADVLYRRTRGADRPLRGASYEGFARRYAERLPHYLEVAAFHLEPGQRPPRRTADEILARLGHPRGDGEPS